jgi:hypothetical protein
MESIRKSLAAFGVLALAMLACNIGVNAPSQPAQQPAQQVNLNDALTLAVQTIQAATQQAASGIPTNTVPPPATAPMVTVSSDTNCRTGPNVNYSFVILFQAGMQAKVVGKYTPANYWIIEIPNGGGSTCWLWGQYATVIGDTAGLSEGVPPPLPPTPTPAPTAPNPPKGLNLSCTSENNSHKVGNFWIISFKWTVKFSWKDNSDNEDGFSVYKNGSLLANLGPGSTHYTDTFNVGLILTGTTWDYGVASYNSYGSSVIKDIELSTCP